MQTCPYCKRFEKQVRAGLNKSGSQRFRCNHCGRKYTPAPKLNGYPKEMRKKIVIMALEGMSFRAIARKMGINPQTVVNWINVYIANSSRAIYKIPKNQKFAG